MSKVFNRAQRLERKLLKKALEEESALVSADSLQILKIFERLLDEFDPRGSQRKSLSGTLPDE